ncbi:MAG: hypothetical protein KAU20_04725 [Nanoarchaeota archaeon]|nr:hypothetical protein [Nanoarchaeota archaeon]
MEKLLFMENPLESSSFLGGVSEILDGNGLLNEKVRDDNIREVKEIKEIRDNKREISDAVGEIIEEGIESKAVMDFEPFSDEKRIMYNLIEEKSGLDYSKLGYGKVTEPLAIEYDCTNYEQKDKKPSFSSDETISIKDVDKIIQEKIVFDLLHLSTTSIKPEMRERFKYWKLFNNALIRIKYAAGI